MSVHRPLVESVDLRRLRGSACGHDVFCDGIERCAVMASEKDPGSFAGKGASHGTADRSSGSVDDRNLVLQQHLWFPFLILIGDAPRIQAVKDVDTKRSGNWARTQPPRLPVDRCPYRRVC